MDVVALDSGAIQCLIVVVSMTPGGGGIHLFLLQAGRCLGIFDVFS